MIYHFKGGLDFARFKNLTKLTIIAYNLGDGSLFTLPSSLTEFCLYRNNSFKDLSMFLTLSEDCNIVIRSLHLSKLSFPKEFKNLKVMPHD